MQIATRPDLYAFSQRQGGRSTTAAEVAREATGTADGLIAAAFTPPCR